MNLTNLLVPSSYDPSYNRLLDVSIPLPPRRFKVPMTKAKPSLPLLPFNFNVIFVWHLSSATENILN